MASGEFVCSECEQDFDSAVLILQHFRVHYEETLAKAIQKVSPITPRAIPDLHPIKTFKKELESDIESDSGIEDVNPVKFCLVTMEDKQEKVRKYECDQCSKKFGWPTDLKRHKLIHTGERPFQCQNCKSAFTRNFLLKKHQRRFHSHLEKLPELRPLITRKDSLRIKELFAESSNDL